MGDTIMEDIETDPMIVASISLGMDGARSSSDEHFHFLSQDHFFMVPFERHWNMNTQYSDFSSILPFHFSHDSYYSLFGQNMEKVLGHMDLDGISMYSVDSMLSHQ